MEEKKEYNIFYLRGDKIGTDGTHLYSYTDHSTKNIINKPDINLLNLLIEYIESTPHSNYETQKFSIHPTGVYVAGKQYCMKISDNNFTSSNSANNQSKNQSNFKYVKYENTHPPSQDSDTETIFDSHDIRLLDKYRVFDAISMKKNELLELQKLNTLAHEFSLLGSDAKLFLA